MTMLKKITLSQQAYEEISRRIVSGKIPAGTRLTEEALCAEFQISRTPVRDALVRLEREGMVELLPVKGCRVREFNRESVRSLFECRALVETEALRLAFQCLPKEKIATLKKRLEQSGKNPLEQKRLSLAVDGQFHELVADCCPNEYLSDILRRLSRQCAAFRQYRTLDGRESPEKITEERLGILNAILGGNRNNACKLLREHILRGGELGAAKE